MAELQLTVVETMRCKHRMNRVQSLHCNLY